MVSVSVGEVEESPALLPPGSPELVWERALVPYSDGISSPLDLEDAGRREQRAIVLDMCYAHLVRRGFGVLELASLRLEESEDIGYQVTEELNLQYEQYIGDSVYLWLKEAKEGSRIVRRTTGYLAGAIAWMDLGRRPAIEGIDDSDRTSPGQVGSPGTPGGTAAGSSSASPVSAGEMALSSGASSPCRFFGQHIRPSAKLSGVPEYPPSPHPAPFLAALVQPELVSGKFDCHVFGAPSLLKDLPRPMLIVRYPLVGSRATLLGWGSRRPPLPPGPPDRVVDVLPDSLASPVFSQLLR